MLGMTTYSATSARDRVRGRYNTLTKKQLRIQREDRDMKKSIAFAVIAAFAVADLILAPVPAEAQKKGQSMSVQHGIVVKSERVDISENKAPSGATMGGTIGLLTGGSSGYKRRRNAAIGAAAGGVLGAAGSTRQMGMMYTIETAGGATKVVTDQTEIHIGDCVVVETANNRANVRRVNREVCDPAAADVVKELEEEFQEEAAECASARAELAAAKTDAEFDRALMKVDILCNN
jgi:antitoxin component of MazEF toxin-antitoxin module